MENDAVFRAKARSAGEYVRKALEKDPDPSSRTPVHVSYDIENFDIEPSEGQANVLREFLKMFENKFSEQQDCDSQVDWRQVFFIVGTLPYDDETSNDTAAIDGKEDAWFLAIGVGGEDKGKIGRSFSLRTRFPVVKGDIFVAYKVNRSQ